MACDNCGHGWLWHVHYDDDLDRWVEHPCEKPGCRCRRFVEAEKPAAVPA